MAKDSKGSRFVSKTKNVVKTTVPTASARIAADGITSSNNFGKLMSAIISDVLNNRISTDVANAACNAGGKMLKCIELRFKYGSSQVPEPKPLSLT